MAGGGALGGDEQHLETKWHTDRQTVSRGRLPVTARRMQVATAERPSR
jgi:hypothetical protein